MRHVTVLVLALALAGSSSALSLHLQPSAAEAIDDAVRMTDDTVALLGALPGGRPGVPAAVEAALALAGRASAPLADHESSGLREAILRLYGAAGYELDGDALAQVDAQVGALAPADALALAALVDAVADAQLASSRILAPQDVALLRDDLATTMKLVTFAGPGAPHAPAMWRAMAQERLDALARADMTQAGAAALRVTRAMAALPELLPVEGCGRAVDLPFIQVGAPCDDTYEEATINLIQIDYGGNDLYLNNAGAGIAGVGVGLSWDMGVGDDRYHAAASAQGAATAGVGILLDEGGSDRYNVSQFGQGFAVAGVAMLYDAGDGDDAYESGNDPASIGTKAGGLGGIGILVDEGGSDLYQQDGLDGFVYGAAGGLGLLVERGVGDDRYLARDLPIVLLGTPLGEFVGPIQVSAEVSATAILYEEGGNDDYVCGDHVRQGCQGAGGVGGVALHLDLDGDDRYALGESISPTLEDVSGRPELAIVPVFPPGQGIAYGEGSAPPGDGIGLLRDFGGNDVYVAGPWAQGYATGGLGLLRDDGGADLYSGHAPLVGTRADANTWFDGLALGIGIDQADG